MAKAAIQRREQDFHRQLTKHDEERAFGRSFAEIAQQHQSVINRTGVAPQRIFHDFLTIMNVLGGNDIQAKAGILRDVAVRHGLTPQQMWGGAPIQNPQPGPSGQQPSPQAMQLPPPVLQMTQEWNEFKQRQEQQQRESVQREEQETYNEIVAFRSKPEARFFDHVKDHMVAMLQAGAATNLEEAYSQAIWARPDIRNILQSEADQARQQAEQRRMQAANARLKGGSVRGGSGSMAPAEGQNRTLREEIQANLREAQSRI